MNARKECAPADGGRRCETHGRPLYPDGRCREASARPCVMCGTEEPPICCMVCLRDVVRRAGTGERIPDYVREDGVAVPLSGSATTAEQARRFIMADDALSARDWGTFEHEGLGSVAVEYERLRALVGAPPLDDEDVAERVDEAAPRPGTTEPHPQDLLDERVRLLDEVCRWLESHGADGTAAAVFAAKDEFLLPLAKRAATAGGEGGARAIDLPHSYTDFSSCSTEPVQGSEAWAPHDMRCPECGQMMTNHVVVTHHESGPCDEQLTGPPIVAVEGVPVEWVPGVGLCEKRPMLDAKLRTETAVLPRNREAERVFDELEAAREAPLRRPPAGAKCFACGTMMPTHVVLCVDCREPDGKSETR